MDNYYNDSCLIHRVFCDIKKVKKNLYINSNIEFTNYHPDIKKGEDKTKLSDLLKTLDGHYVRSKNEQIIDNILYNNMIMHCYEKEVAEVISNQISLKANWFIPISGNKGLYVLYCKESKKTDVDENKFIRQLFIDNEIPFIEIKKDDLKDINSLTDRINKELKILGKKYLNGD